MALEASVLLEKDLGDPIARSILSFIAKLDEWGAATVDLRLLGVVTFFVLLLVRVTMGKHRGVDWYALLHALVTGLGSLMTTYLDVFAAEALTGIAEPLRSSQCHPPLTSLHRMLPAITMGYSSFDFLDGLTLGLEFALHGAATLFVMTVYVLLHAAHIITPMLVMEVSTINLTMVRADFFPDSISFLNQLSFALFFFLFRVLFCPYWWTKLMWAMWTTRAEMGDSWCLSPWLIPVASVFGPFFHLLNLYWFYKIVRKIKRKLSGTEGLKANNDLDQLDDDTDKKKTEQSSANGSMKKDK